MERQGQGEGELHAKRAALGKLRLGKVKGFREETPGPKHRRDRYRGKKALNAKPSSLIHFFLAVGEQIISGLAVWASSIDQ